MRLTTVPASQLRIDDEPFFRHVGLYQDLKQVLFEADFKFLVPDGDAAWDRVLFLNLTFYSPVGESSEILVDDHINADVLMHVAWHHLARRAFAGTAPSADAIFLGESIASAFDLYLVGRLLGIASESSFLETQIPQMADTALAAGMSEPEFAAMLDSIATDPERAFEDLRALLFDVGTTLVNAASADRAAECLARFDSHRFAALLHHYELSNWILYARAFAKDALGPNRAAREIDAALRSAPRSIDWLETNWVRQARRPR